MKVIKKYDDGPILIEPDVFKDERGYFYESFNEQEFREKVADVTFVQDNQSKSTYGTIRGMHFQKGAHAQAKLVRVINGAVIDVVVDVRPDSKNYLKTYTAYLSEENNRQFFVPRGFAHGFVSISPNTIFQYKCDNYYNKESEGSFLFTDVPGFEWDYYMPKDLWLVSQKDGGAPRLGSVDFSSFLGLSNGESVEELDLDKIQASMHGIFHEPLDFLADSLVGCYVEHDNGMTGIITGFYLTQTPTAKLRVRETVTNTDYFLSDLKGVKRIYRKKI